MYLTVASIDSVAEKGIISLKEKYPSVTQSPEKVSLIYFALLVNPFPHNDTF